MHFSEAQCTRAQLALREGAGDSSVKTHSSLFGEERFLLKGTVGGATMLRAPASRKAERCARRHRGSIDRLRGERLSRPADREKGAPCVLPFAGDDTIPLARLSNVAPAARKRARAEKCFPLSLFLLRTRCPFRGWLKENKKRPSTKLGTRRARRCRERNPRRKRRR